MKNYRVSIDGFFTIGELHYMEDVVNEYTDKSVIDGALEDVPENELDQAYWQCIVMAFLRESIMRGRREKGESLDNLINEMC